MQWQRVEKADWILFLVPADESSVEIHLFRSNTWHWHGFNFLCSLYFFFFLNGRESFGSGAIPPFPLAVVMSKIHSTSFLGPTMPVMDWTPRQCRSESWLAH